MPKVLLFQYLFHEYTWLTKAGSCKSVRHILPVGDKTGNCTAQRIAFECPTPATFKVMVFVGPFQPRTFCDSWVTQPLLQGAQQGAEAQRLQDCSFCGLCMDSIIGYLKLVLATSVAKQETPMELYEHTTTVLLEKTKRRLHQRS